MEEITWNSWLHSIFYNSGWSDKMTYLEWLNTAIPFEYLQQLNLKVEDFV